MSLKLGNTNIAGAQVYDATETVKGIVRLATSEEVTAGTNDSAAITPLKLKSKLDTKQDKSTAVNYNNISNCITEIPQDIKLELNNGTLTLKAGSKVYVPNGAGVFDAYISTLDRTKVHTVNGTYMAFLNQNKSIDIVQTIYVYSGASQPTGIGQYSVWYDTTNNIVKKTGDAGSTWINDYSLPICVFTVSSNVISSIDQVFNGFGYIGSTVFALPGVKGLIPNGRNADGSLKNIEFSVDTVKISTITDTKSFYIYISSSNFYASKLTEYDEDKNVNYGTVNLDIRGVCCCGSVVTGSNKKVISLAPKTVFHALDYNESSRIVSIMDTKVSKSGDTMTGNLTITGDGWNLYMQSNSISYNTAPSSWLNKTIAFVDKNGGSFGAVEIAKQPENINDIYLNVFSPKGSWCPIPLGLRADGRGNFGSTAPRCNWDNSIVTTVSHGSNYVRFGNGLIIQWGTVSGTGGTITLPTPFSNTNYGVTFTRSAASGTNDNDAITTRRTTSFDVTIYQGGGGNWIAIGY